MTGARLKSQYMLYADRAGISTLTCTNNADAASKRVDMRKAQLRVRRAWKVRECDRLGCSTQIRQQDGLNVMMAG